jgi:hypothetical protein
MIAMNVLEGDLELKSFDAFPDTPVITRKGRPASSTNLARLQTFEAYDQLNYFDKVYTAALIRFGPEQCQNTIKHMMEMIGLVAAVLAAFMTSDLPDTKATTDHDVLLAFGLVSFSTRALALATVCISVLVHIQVGFYHPDEFQVFLAKFAFVLNLPVVFMGFTIVLSLVGMCLHVWIQLGYSAAYYAVCIGMVLAVPSVLLFPIMDIPMRRFRHQAVEALRRAEATRPVSV